MKPTAKPTTKADATAANTPPSTPALTPAPRNGLVEMLPTDEAFLTATGWTQEPDGTWRNPKAFHFTDATGQSHYISDEVKRDAASAVRLERLRPKE